MPRNLRTILGENPIPDEDPLEIEGHRYVDLRHLCPYSQEQQRNIAGAMARSGHSKVNETPWIKTQQMR